MPQALNTKSIQVKGHYLSFQQVPQMSNRDIAYTLSDPRLRDFYKYPVELENFEQVIRDKEKDVRFRSELVEAITHQYADLSAGPEVINNITALADKNTFTVITAHQPSLFTGPLYYIYKIVSVINLSRQLASQYPDYKFVPVFITGGEDHDFEEINHLHLFGKTLQWQNEESGPVGAMKTASLGPVLDQLESILGNSENAQNILELIKSSYTKHETFGKATICFTHELFKANGLVIVNMNDPKLKRCFIPIIKKEVLEKVSHPFVEQSSKALDKLGFKTQATPREINFFYLRQQLRERIVFEDEKYKVLNTEIEFSATEIEKEIEEHPERFSPNVIMRPLYQEWILPNLAYIGGGGELAYWLERKTQFEYFGINYPMLIRRNSVLWIDKASSKKLKKLGFGIEEFFGDTEALIKAFVNRQADNKLNLSAEKEELKLIFDQVFASTVKIDPTLGKTVRAEQAKQIKSLEILEAKVMRAEKQKHETALNQIRALKEKLFPGHGLQERYDNFIGFFLKYGPQFFDLLFEHLDPLDKRFLIVEESSQQEK